jgi:hypothetical protein
MDGKTGTNTQGEVRNGTWSSVFRAHEFFIKKYGPCDLYTDPDGGLNIILYGSRGKIQSKDVYKQQGIEVSNLATDPITQGLFLRARKSTDVNTLIYRHANGTMRRWMSN